MMNQHLQTFCAEVANRCGELSKDGLTNRESIIRSMLTEALIASRKTITCAYCGSQFANATEEDRSVIQQHLLKCDASPLVRLIKHSESLLYRIVPIMRHIAVHSHRHDTTDKCPGCVAIDFLNDLKHDQMPEHFKEHLPAPRDGWVRHPWNEEDPRCVHCGDTMELGDGCEWHEDARLNLCMDCALLLLEHNSR